MCVYQRQILLHPLTPLMEVLHCDDAALMFCTCRHRVQPPNQCAPLSRCAPHNSPARRIPPCDSSTQPQSPHPPASASRTTASFPCHRLPITAGALHRNVAVSPPRLPGRSRDLIAATSVPFWGTAEPYKKNAIMLLSGGRCDHALGLFGHGGLCTSKKGG